MADITSNDGLVRSKAHAAAIELHERVREYSHNRRSTTVAQRLFRLPTEALLGVAVSAVSGAVLSTILALIDIIPGSAAAVLAFPFTLLASASAPMLLYRYLRSRNLSTHAALLQLLHDEIRGTSVNGETKEYVAGLYKLRASLVNDLVVPDGLITPPRDSAAKGANVDVAHTEVWCQEMAYTEPRSQQPTAQSSAEQHHNQSAALTTPSFSTNRAGS